MRKLLSFVGVGLVSLALAGCTVRLVDFTALSSKNCDIRGKRGERVRGEDMAWMILGFPTRVPNIKEATDRAIEKGGGDLLVDGVVYSKYFTAIVVGKFGYIVEGTSVHSKR